MTRIVAGMLSDCLSVMGIPTATASAVLSKLINKRHNMLREILLCEMRQGNFDNVDQDDLASVLFRLIRDAEEGVARNNLHLLARVINGMADNDELKAPTFLKYANILSSLSEEEILVLGIMESLSREEFYTDQGANKYKKYGIKDHQIIQQALIRTGLVKLEISSKIVDYDSHYVSKTGVEKGVANKYVYRTTPLFGEILKYTDFILESKEE